ncbi:MAG: ABC transporter substrate-binding protein [Planctomycetota bacterium]
MNREGIAGPGTAAQPAMGSRRSKGRPLALSLSIAALGVSGCGLLVSPVRTNVLVYAAPGELRVIDPLDPRGGWNEATSLIYNRLFRLDAEGRIVPDLALEETVPADPRVHRLRLRTDVFWHDGTPFSAADVEHTLRRVAEGEVNEALKPLQQLLHAFGRADDQTIVLELEEPRDSVKEVLLPLGVVPTHLSRRQERGISAAASLPVGTGPFKLIQIDARGQLWFERHEAFHLGEPRLERFVVKCIPEDSERARLVRRGEVDLTPVSAREGALLEPVPSVTVHRVLAGDVLALTLNVRRPVFAQAESREAVDRALDREALARDLSGTPAFSPVHPRCWASSALRRPAPDARKGGEKGKDSTAPTEETSASLEIDLAVWQEDALARRASEVIRDQLAPMGITVRRHLLPGSAPNEQSDLEPFDAILSEWDALLDPVNALWNRFHSQGAQNLGGFIDPEVDRLLDRLLEMPQGDTARATVAAVLDRLAQSRPCLPLIYPEQVFAARRGLRNVSVQALRSSRELTAFAYRWSF